MIIKTFTPLIGAASVAGSSPPPRYLTIPIWGFVLIAYFVLPVALILGTRTRRECLSALFKDKAFASGPAWKNHVFRAAVCAGVIILWPVALLTALIEWLREKKSELQEKARRKREGIRKRQDYGFVTVVKTSEWTPEVNNLVTDWVEGEIRELLPDDTVLEYGWLPAPLCGQGGYAIERKGRIIAEHTAWVS